MRQLARDPNLQYLALTLIAVEVAAIDWWLIRHGRRTLSQVVRANPRLHGAVRHLEGHLTRDMAIDVLKMMGTVIANRGVNNARNRL